MLAGEIVKIKTEVIDKYPCIHSPRVLRVDTIQGSAQKDETAIAVYKDGNYLFTTYVKTDDIHQF